MAGKDVTANILYVVQGGEHPALYRQGLRASRLHWIGDPPAALPFDCRARIRHQQPLQDCTVTALDDDGIATVMFDQPQRAVAAGQSVVFYTGEVCLGGGIIEGGIDQT